MIFRKEATRSKTREGSPTIGKANPTRDSIWPNIFIASTIIDFQVPAVSPSMDFHNVSKSVMYLAGKSFNLSMMYWIIFFTAHPKAHKRI